MKVARRKRRLVARIKKLKGPCRKNVGTLGQLMILDAERKHEAAGGPALTDSEGIVKALAAAGHVEGDARYVGRAGGVLPGSRQPDAIEGGAEGEEPSGRELFRRQAAERKAVKAQVALIKKEKKRLRPKVMEDRQKKKELNLQMKRLVRETRRRQDAEVEESVAAISARTDDDVDMM